MSTKARWNIDRRGKIRLTPRVEDPYSVDEVWGRAFLYLLRPDGLWSRWNDGWIMGSDGLDPNPDLVRARCNATKVRLIGGTC